MSDEIDNVRDTKSVLSKFGINDADHTDMDVEHVLAAVTDAQSRFGLIRLQLGALLLAVKQKELWRGKAGSFGEYLEAEKIKPSAASQYMKVAEKLLFELKLNEAELKAVSRCSMTTLVKACAMMNRHNKADVISLLESLSDRDTNHALSNFAEYQQPLQEHRPQNPTVKKLVNEFFRLPNDLRVDVMRQIGGRTASISQRNVGHQQSAEPMLRIVKNG